MNRPAPNVVAGAAACAFIAGLLTLTASVAADAELSFAAPTAEKASASHKHSNVQSHTTTTSPRGAAASDDITRSARIGYLSCPAPDVLLRVSIQVRPFAPGQPVTYRVSVHNLSRTTCGTPGRTLPMIPSQPNLAVGLIGPCGELSVVIYDAGGTNVYPGPVAYGCPMIVGPTIAPGRTIATTGMWPMSASRGPGRYRLVVDGTVTLPIVIAGPPPTPPAVTAPTPIPEPPVPSSSVPPPSSLPTPTVPSRLPTPGSSEGISPPTPLLRATPAASDD